MLDKHDLIKLKDKIENKKEIIQQAKGKEAALLQQLKKDWDCDSVEQAKEKVKEFSKLKESNDAKIEKKSKKLSKLLGDES